MKSNASATNLPFVYPRSCTTPDKYLYPRLEIVEQIASALIPSRLSSNAPRPSLLTFVLTGLGGMGKTSIAKQFVQKFKTQFEVILFLQADQVGRLSEHYAKVAVQLGLVEAGMGADLDLCREAVKAWLENPIAMHISNGESTGQADSKSFRQATWLLVLDGADDANVLADFWPVTGVGSVLVTSRDPFTRTQYFYPTAGLQLEGLPQNEGVALLKALTSNLKEKHSAEAEDAARIITRHLGGLPLALYQIGAIIQRHGYSFTSFLAAYARDSDYYELYDERPIPRAYEHNLGSVWAFESIENGSALVLLQVISMLDPEQIHEDLLVDLDNKALLATYPKSRKAYHQALSYLLETSMVEKNRDDGLLSVHPLVQDVCRARMAKTDDESQAALSQALYAVSLSWPFTITKRQFKTGSAGKIERWTKCAKLYAHIVSLSRNAKELVHISKMKSVNMELVDLLCEAAW